MSLSNVLTMSPLLQHAESIGSLKVQLVWDCILLGVFDMSVRVNMLWTSACYLTAACTALFGHSDGSGCTDPRLVIDVLNAGFGVLVIQFVFNIVFSNFAVSRIERQ
eukprot:8462421-Pyramimonas_sp.AAC.1